MNQCERHARTIERRRVRRKEEEKEGGKEEEEKRKKMREKEVPCKACISNTTVDRCDPDTWMVVSYLLEFVIWTNTNRTCDRRRQAAT
jgi:hypothetical protein